MARLHGFTSVALAARWRVRAFTWKAKRLFQHTELCAVPLDGRREAALDLRADLGEVSLVGLHFLGLEPGLLRALNAAFSPWPRVTQTWNLQVNNPLHNPNGDAAEIVSPACRPCTRGHQKWSPD